MKEEKHKWAIEEFVEVPNVELFEPPAIVAKAGQLYTKAYAVFFSQYTNLHTQKQYTTVIGAYFAFLNQHGIALEDTEAPHILGYIGQRQDKRRKDRLSDYSIRPHITALKEFYRLCALCGARKDNPAALIKTPRISRHVGATEVLTNKELKAVLDFECSKPSDYRDKALLATMAYSFFRISAALQMRVSDYRRDSDGMWLHGQEKNGHAHIMPAKEILAEILDAYLLETGIKKYPDAYLFPSSHGRSGKLYPLKPYTANSAWAMAGRRAIAADIDESRRIGNHSFRASGLTEFMKTGGTLKQAQDLAGHSDISTTQLYDRSKIRDRAKLLSK